MVRLRLRRVGLRNQPSYRIIAADKEKSRDGRFLEIVGFYNPRTEPSTIELKEDRIFSWLSQGAQPSDSVAQIFKEMGLMDRFTKFRSGESAEALAEEAKKVFASRIVSNKTTKAPKTKEVIKTKEATKAKEAPKPMETPKAEDAPKVEEVPDVKEAQEAEESFKEE